MSDPAAAFDALVRDYYQAWFRFHPEVAVDVGVPGYAHLLTPYGEQAIGALVCLNDALRAGLEELDVSALDTDRRLDGALLAGAVRLENQRLIELESRRPDPEALLPVHAIYQLTIRTVEDFEDALQARLAAIPAHLAGARDYLLARAEHLPPLWVRSAIAAARGQRVFARAAIAPQAREPRRAGDGPVRRWHGAVRLRDISGIGAAAACARWVRLRDDLFQQSAALPAWARCGGRGLA